MSQQNLINKGKVVFLIGAGASVAVDIPAMKEIFENFMDPRKSKISKSEKELSEFFLNELGVEKDLEEFLLAANLMIESPDSSLMKLIKQNIAKRSDNKLVPQFEKRYLGKISEIEKLKDSILKFMSTTCFKFDRTKALEYYSNFIESIASNGYPLFTTNYDFVYEYVAEEKDIDINDNFIKNGQSKFWNKKISFPIGNGLTLIKLHGSVSWYKDSNNEIEKIEHDTPLNPMGKEIHRLVIFPTRFKDIYAQHFFALYSQFLSFISEAQLIIIIGHSLRDEYLKAGIIERYRKGRLYIIIISPIISESLIKEISSSNSGVEKGILQVPYKFEFISDDLAYVLKNFKPDEIVGELTKIIRQDRTKKNKMEIKGRLKKLKAENTVSIKVKVKAYLNRETRPSFLKAWLITKIKKTDGTIETRRSVDFIEMTSIKLADNLTGYIDSEYTMQLLIPKIKSWAEEQAPVELLVAMCSKDVKKTAGLNNEIIIEQTSRKVLYGL